MVGIASCNRRSSVAEFSSLVHISGGLRPQATSAGIDGSKIELGHCGMMETQWHMKRIRVAILTIIRNR